MSKEVIAVDVSDSMLVEAENQMLTQYGHQVSQWIEKSSDIEDVGSLAHAKIALNSIWSSEFYRAPRLITLLRIRKV